MKLSKYSNNKHIIKEDGRWQQEYQTLFDRVPCYLTVINKDFIIVRANDAFHENFGDALNQHCYEVYKRKNTKCRNCPAVKTFKDGKVHRSNQQGISKRGQKIYYIVTTSAIIKGTKNINYVIEISPMKKLEEKVIEANRLGAVGQTVAGLAHSIKNILMGLEGGKYIVSLGLKKKNQDMINKGWEMLERNFDKTTSLVKDFLSFSKGRIPSLEMVNPVDLVLEIVDLYKEIAAKSGIELRPEFNDNIRPAPLDKKGIHTCLTNLVSNAMDACLMSERRGSLVNIKVLEKGNKLTFEVSDNGSGIDYEIKKKIFTTFFTTKGGAGTGLGLLTTRKIVEEHGGKITVISEKGKGANFKIEFSYKRLMALYKQAKK